MPLPPGRALELPGRGRTFIREVQGPPGAPTIFLLHGWTATADLNWSTCFDALGEHFRIIAPDHRGHGKGINSKNPFSLEDCADDVAAIADVLGINTFIPVGYSMGGTIAQLVWKRHESRVRGLVLCSTAASFAVSREERLSFLGLSGLAVLARLTPKQTIEWLTEQLYMQRKVEGLEPWAIKQMASHDWRKIIQAGSAIGNFDSTKWLNEIDVPVSVIITTQDQVVPFNRQQRLIDLLDDVDAHFIDGTHNVVYADHRTYVPLLLSAITSVHQRSSLSL